MPVLCSGTMEQRWVPLLLLLVPWLPGLHSCLLCFGPPIQWARLCREMARSSQDSQHQHCLEALAEAAVPLAPVTVGAGQSEALRKIVMDALHLLEKQKDKKPFEVSLREAIQIIWVKLSQLEQAPACIPPCGHQPAARIFQCSTCRLVDCQFPVDCPVQDVWVHEDEAVTLRCDVPFAVPPELQVTWMFAKDIRTQDLALFEELQRGAGEPPGLTVQDPTLGTIACRLGAASETLARNVGRKRGGRAGAPGPVQSCAALAPGQSPPAPHHIPAAGIGPWLRRARAAAAAAAGLLAMLPKIFGASQTPVTPGHPMDTRAPKGVWIHVDLHQDLSPEGRNISSCSSCIVHGV
ncbi:sperm acrosome membrane-associated protein 6 isoform X3 [Meleagris gallopavo]|uniref:sperm acrosome membrane-associated protein 6 isoform X3 n=1 Tax=Meleagris gallopavo TaxID=9103 RepID=UPI00093CE005|nr:sperm acrosome membrane-associated protein 6 isoform X3 [Meleagris gallopavo]